MLQGARLRGKVVFDLKLALQKTGKGFDLEHAILAETGAILYIREPHPSLKLDELQHWTD